MAPIGKRLTKLKKDGKIKAIPHSERQASKNMRGQYYGKNRDTYEQYKSYYRCRQKNSRFNDR